MSSLLNPWCNLPKQFSCLLNPFSNPSKTFSRFLNTFSGLPGPFCNLDPEPIFQSPRATLQAPEINFLPPWSILRPPEPTIQLLVFMLQAPGKMFLVSIAMVQLDICYYRGAGGKDACIMTEVSIEFVAPWSV